MTSPAARIEQLLRLATNNPNEEEARSAALKLCRMLVEHKAKIVVPLAQQPAPQPFSVTFDGPDISQILRDAARRQQQAAEAEFRRKYYEAQAQKAKVAPRREHSWRPPDSPPFYYTSTTPQPEPTPPPQPTSPPVASEPEVPPSFWSRILGRE